MTKTHRGTLVALTVTLGLLAAACGDDDGESVREIGAASGSASGSGSGSASGSASASASASASGTAAAQSTGLGGYEPVSDVEQHANVTLDICAIDELLPEEGPLDDESIAEIYTEGGNSTTSEGEARTLAGFASTERDEPIWNDYVGHFGDPVWLDTFVTDAIGASGPFEGEPDPVRRQGIQKGVRNQIMVAWMLHELVSAAGKVEAGEIDPAEGAPHNWDEAWAFYHGADPSCAPYSTADSRGENFGTGTAVNEAILAAMQEGQQATLAGDSEATQTALDEVLRQVTITYVQATIRYAAQMEAALGEGDEESARVQQAEGWSFWRVIEPLVAGVDADAAASITAVYDLAGAPSAAAADVLAAIESTYTGLDIDPDEVGELQP
jgi:hypothetical protein